MASDPSLSTDRAPGSLGDPPLADFVRQRQADRGQAQASAAYEGGTAPPPVDTPPRLDWAFGSPLRLDKTNFVTTVEGTRVRLVTSGWGDARSTTYGVNDGARRHGGLDYAGIVGEEVLAAADGEVTFVGVQLRLASRQVMRNPRAADNGDVVGDDATVPMASLGFGGLYVAIRHTGPLSIYQSESMHLSAASKGLVVGAKVTRGQVIGLLGRTGGVTGQTRGPHLHFQLRSGGLVVRSEPLMPHYNPRQPGDSRADLLAAAQANFAAQGSPVAALSAAARAEASQALGQGRRDTIIGESRAQTQKRWADAATQRGAQSDQAAARLSTAQALASSPPVVVVGGALFNFETGLWPDGRPT